MCLFKKVIFSVVVWNTRDNNTCTYLKFCDGWKNDLNKNIFPFLVLYNLENHFRLWKLSDQSKRIKTWGILKPDHVVSGCDISTWSQTLKLENELIFKVSL